MQALRRSRLLLILALAVLPRQQVIAQVTQSCSGSAVTRPDLSIELALDHGQKVFRQGEIVRLRIQYSSRSESKYLLDNRNYDRSGRLDGLDLICLQPDLGADPLDDYFHSFAGFASGGLFSEPQITVKPLWTEMELNEWRSLPPGEYRLSILSKRVSEGNQSNPKSWKAVSLQSNWITFRIIEAEPVWQSSILSGAIKTLDSSKSTEEETENAARELRFLNSEDAARELVRRFWRSSPENLRWDLEAGLWGNPFRRTAIREMKSILRESRDGNRRWFIDVLVNLEMQTDSRFRQLRYDSELAVREKDPGSSCEKEHKRRASEYELRAASGTLK